MSVYRRLAKVILESKTVLVGKYEVMRGKCEGRQCEGGDCGGVECEGGMWGGGGGMCVCVLCL